MAAFPKFGRGGWKDFYDPADDLSEISHRRPFYPNRPGGSRRQHLIDGLKLEGPDELFRRCDGPTDLRSAANPMFWTMGAQQVGKAAISGWRDLIAPALRGDPAFHIWPFDGRLTELLTRPGITVAEVYPGEIYGHLKLRIAASNKSKLNAEHRREDAVRLFDWAADNEVQLSAALAGNIRDGFWRQPRWRGPVRCHGRPVRHAKRDLRTPPFRRATRSGGAADRGLDSGAGYEEPERVTAQTQD